MEGIAIGTVVSNWDEDHPGMIQVELLNGADGELKTDWIPVMTPFGGSSYGSYYLPEAGNTVVIGFEAGSRNCPIVLGCLWSQDNPLPSETANEKNSKLLWKSKSGYSFFVEEEEKKIAWSDPEGKNTLVWSTKEKTLTLDVEETLVLKIGGEEFLTLKKGAVTVKGELKVDAEAVTVQTESLESKSAQDMVLKAKNIKLSPEQNTSIAGNKTEISPGQGVTIKTQSLKAEGTTVALKGQQTAVEGTTLELKAQASGKLSSSGILEVKGSLVKIN